MPQAQFFQLNPQSSFADDIKSGYEAGYNIREGQRKKALNEIYSKHVKPDGSFDSENFLKEATDAGIGPEMTSTWLNQKTAKSEATVKEATNAEMLSVLGRKPDVLRDWFIQEKEKAAKLNNPTEQGDGGPLTPSTLDVDKLSDNRDEVERKQAVADSKVTDSGIMLSPPAPSISAVPVSQQLQNMFNKKGIEGIQASDAADLLDRVPGNSDRTDISGRFYSAPEGKFTEKDISNLTAQPFNEVEQGKKYDVVEEALRREPGQSGPAGKLGDIQTPETFQSDSVKWEPKDDGSNEYRQFKTALDSQLKSLDMKSASDYLQKIGENTYKQNLYVPNQMAWMTKEGKIDYSAMGAEIAKVKDSDQKARAKAEEAIQKAKDSLMETAKKYGVDTVEGRKLDIENYKLRDSSKRTEAASLITNKQNISNAKAAIKDAGVDTTKLALAAPQVIRAYATALNPGQQLSEGNLIEVSKVLYPDMASKPEFVAKLAGGLMRGIKDDDWSVFDQLTNYVDAGAPTKVAARMAKIASEAAVLNEKNLDNYVISQEKSDDAKTKVTPAAKAMAKPAKSVTEKKTETALERVRRLRGKN